MSFFGALIGGMGEAAIDMSDSVIAERKEQRLLELQRKYDTWKQDRADRLAQAEADRKAAAAQTEYDRRAAAEKAEADRRHELAMQRIEAGRGAPKTINDRDGNILMWDHKEGRYVPTGRMAPLEKDSKDKVTSAMLDGWDAEISQADSVINDPNSSPEQIERARRVKQSTLATRRKALGIVVEEQSGNLISGTQRKTPASEGQRLGGMVKQGITSGKIANEDDAWKIIGDKQLPAGTPATHREYMMALIINSGLDPNNAPDDFPYKYLLTPAKPAGQTTAEPSKPVSEAAASEDANLITKPVEPSGQSSSTARQSGEAARENVNQAVEAVAETPELIAEGASKAAEGVNKAGRAVSDAGKSASKSLQDWINGFLGRSEEKVKNADAKKLIEGLVMYEQLFQSARTEADQTKYLKIINKLKKKLNDAGYSDAKIKEMKSSK